MKNDQLHILWVSTSHYPAPGGAPIYMKYLGELMDASSRVDHATVLAEAYPKQPKISYARHKKLEVRRIFPFRGGAEKKNAIAYLKYGVQNLHFLKIPMIAKEIKANVVVLHSWYFLNPSVLSPLIKQLKKQGIKLVADMRDAALPKDKFHKLYDFDALICCGQRVMEHFANDKNLAPKRHYIPVPLEDFPIDSTACAPLLKKHDLQKNGYIFAPIGISNQKRFPLLFDAWQHLLQQGTSLDLVIAGKNRDWQPRYEIKTKNGKLVLTGLLDRNDIHALYAGAALSMSPSTAESFGRVPAEAIQHGKPILFPAGIPEYKDIPDDFICNTDDPLILAQKIKQAIALGKPGFDYNLAQHSFEEVCEKTLNVFSSLIKP